MIEEQAGWVGKWAIKVIDSKTRKVKEETVIKNRLMNTALDEMAKVLLGQSTDMEIKYLALGTGSTAITDTDTTLATEIFRTADQSLTDTGTGEVTSLFIVLDSEAVAAIEEIGVFGGTTATASADSGTLISRILWSRNKTNSEEIQFTRVDTIGRG